MMANPVFLGLLIFSSVLLLVSSDTNQTCSSLNAHTCLSSHCALINVSSCTNASGLMCVENCSSQYHPLEQICALRVENNTEIYYLVSVGCNGSLPHGLSPMDPSMCLCEKVHQLDLFRRIMPLIVLVIVIFFLIYPIDVPVSEGMKKVGILSSTSTCKFSIPLDFATIPVLAVLTLMACGTLTPSQILQSILGDDRIQPYNIIILFFALAYLCVSLDVTGVFDYISIKAINATKGSGAKLFLAIFALSSTLTVFTSNDIVILTLTPIICGVSKFTGVDATPFLFVQFFMANIWSVLLFIGNPTNIIVAIANKLTFLEYSQWMALPCIGAGLTCLVVVWLRFKSQIPETVSTQVREPSLYLKDRFGAVYGFTCLFCCLALLLASAWIPQLPLWAITIIFSGLLLVKDLAHDFCSCYPKTQRKAYRTTLNEKTPIMDNNKEPEKGLDTTGLDPSDDEESGDEVNNKQQKKQKKENKYQSAEVASRLPWKIIFFVFGVFIIVDALKIADWTDLFGSWLASAIGPDDSPLNIFISVYLVGVTSIFACNILNNQPMTILFTTILQEDDFMNFVGPKSAKGAMFSLILGSNLGANITLIGALAGIMWASILDRRGITISYLKFAGYGLTVMPLVIAVSCGVLAAEIIYFPH